MQQEANSATMCSWHVPEKSISGQEWVNACFLIMKRVQQQPSPRSKTHVARVSGWLSGDACQRSKFSLSCQTGTLELRTIFKNKGVTIIHHMTLEDNNNGGEGVLLCPCASKG